MRSHSAMQSAGNYTRACSTTTDMSTVLMVDEMRSCAETSAGSPQMKAQRNKSSFSIFANLGLVHIDCSSSWKPVSLPKCVIDTVSILSKGTEKCLLNYCMMSFDASDSSSYTAKASPSRNNDRKDYSFFTSLSLATNPNISTAVKTSRGILNLLHADLACGYINQDLYSQFYVYLYSLFTCSTRLQTTCSFIFYHSQVLSLIFP